MHREFLMGNEAIALGALAAGVNVVCGYPGTPSTEVLETVAKRNPGNVYVEWSINEKAAMEVAAGAAYSGARALVTMKQVGLNVASDPLMSLEYIGVKGGLVVLVADDPGPISSQTEQDTRTFGMFSKVPVLDPSTVEEAYGMVGFAFSISEKYGTPVFLRPTTRIDHGYGAVDVADPQEYLQNDPSGFVKDPSRWVIFPRLSVRNHALIEERNDKLASEFSSYSGNEIVPACGKYASSGLGIVSSGSAYACLWDALSPASRPRLLKVGTPFPFPEALALSFLSGLSSVLVLEDLDPVIERALIFLCGRHGISVNVKGKLSGSVKRSGELSPDEIAALAGAFAGPDCIRQCSAAPVPASSPDLPVRPPVLCAGCPHRASFYAVKKAMKGKKTIFCGDIGCYTLGNAKPLDMCDTCLCMGAGINIAQGVWHVEPDTKAFAFVGDSTFFASGITGSVNGFFNQSDMTLCVLDNSTTAMTGHQPHPGTGMTMMGDVVEKVDIESVLRGLGVSVVETVNPLDLSAAVSVVRKVADMPGFKAIIFKYPCIVKFRPRGEKAVVDESRCVGCRRCINELGCPGVIWKDGKAAIDPVQCTGCTLCEQVCPVGAISGGQAKNLGETVAAAQAKARAAALASQEPVFSKAVKLAERMGQGADPASFAAGGAAADDSVERSIVLAGVGGQGTVLASKLISSACVRRGLKVRSAETIGMAQRGGSVSSYIKIGGGPMSPLMREGTADVIIGFEPGETVRMLPLLKEGGTVITSVNAVYPVSALTGAAPYDAAACVKFLSENVPNLVLIDTEAAMRSLGNSKVMNVLLLGQALKTRALGLTEDDIVSAIKERLPEKLWYINFSALNYQE